jgi:PAS domain S-box-containing protein
MGKIKRRISKIFLIDTDEPFFSEQSRKVFLIASFSYMGLFSLIYFAFDGVIKGNYFYSLVLACFALVTAAFIMTFSFYKEKFNIAGYGLTLLMFLLVVALLFLFGTPQHALLWQYVFIPLAFFLIGKFVGVILALLLYAVTLIFFNFHPDGELISNSLFFRYSFAYGILLYFLFLYEFVRKRTMKSLLEAKDRVSELLAESIQQHEEIKTQNEEIRAQSEQINAVNNQLEKLSYVAKHTDNAVVILDKEGHFEWVNEGFEKLFGVKIMDIPFSNRTIQKLSKKEDIVEILERCVTNRKSVNYQSMQTHADGHELFLNSTITPIFDSDGNIDKFIIVDSDISLIKRTQHKLEELNKTLKSKVAEEVQKNREKDLLLIQQSRQAAMGEMISNIAHQWRQPLNAIGIIVQNLSEAYLYGEIDEKYLNQKIEKVMSLISYMSETIDDFRSFFKPERKAQKFFVKDAVSKAISFIEANFKHLSIELKFSSKNNPVAFGYPNEYMQVIINILNNARDALLESSIKDPIVKIDVSDENDGSLLRIFNNGKCIGDEIADKIFDPYFSTKHISRGTGLGLYMGKNIIENNMSGKFYFINKSEGVEFVIELPNSNNFD